MGCRLYLSWKHKRGPRWLSGKTLRHHEPPPVGGSAERLRPSHLRWITRSPPDQPQDKPPYSHQSADCGQHGFGDLQTQIPPPAPPLGLIRHGHPPSVKAAEPRLGTVDSIEADRATTESGVPNIPELRPFCVRLVAHPPQHPSVTVFAEAEWVPNGHLRGTETAQEWPDSGQELPKDGQILARNRYALSVFCFVPGQAPSAARGPSAVQASSSPQGAIGRRVTSAIRVRMKT